MSETVHSSEDLQHIYKMRFAGKSEYRQRVWSVLCRFFARWIPAESTVLDLGCGHCEFINSMVCHRKLAMDLNPDAKLLANPDVLVIQQDCSRTWEIAESSLDAVFTSNFFEHLPDKPALERTLREAYRALKPGGHLVAMGPNVRIAPGQYWDFFDHYLPLTESSLAEVLRKCGFEVIWSVDRFLPYTMSNGREYPIWMLRIFLGFPVAWKLFGKQFLVVAQK